MTEGYVNLTEAEKRQHRCCFTGHRPEKLNDAEENVKGWLAKEIENAIERGFTTFISGMAMGVDLWAAEIVIGKRKENPNIHLIVATPFPTFSHRWNEQWQKKYSEVWNTADYRATISKGFSNDVFQKRNEWMVNHSSLVIACYNGAKGGTKNMINYARSIGVPVVVPIEE